MKILAPAKLNLSLDVTGKLPGGYHSLCMVMESVEFGDDITLTLREDGEICLENSLDWLPSDGRNLAVKSVSVFREALRQPSLGADIRIEKRIPVGAGMGGGSTDAAAVLRALNVLTGCPFNTEQLRALGLQIGSDVPYCVTGGSFLAKGRGEILSPLPMPPDCAVVVAKPRFSVSTAELFHRIDSRVLRIHPDTDGMLVALSEGSLSGVARRMFNVFEDVLPRAGDILALKSSLLDGGAPGAVMTGTGSAVFGLFKDPSDAEAACDALKRQNCFAVVTRFLPACDVTPSAAVS